MNELALEALVRGALIEDLGERGDITTDAIVPPGRAAKALIVARADGVISGLAPALTTFRLLDSALTIRPALDDGATVVRGDTIVALEGSARAIFAGERTALNFLAHLSGIATATRRLVDLVAHSKAKITCTRKTTPGLRALEKAAVRDGGGLNHRFGLGDAILIKDNHIGVAGSVSAAIAAARSSAGARKIEVEVEDLQQLREALASGVDAVLLDNMDTSMLREAVAIAGGRAVCEASGNVTATSVAAIAATGVDLISVGWITHSAPALDIALDIA